jgi:hypothetical protein
MARVEVIATSSGNTQDRYLPAADIHVVQWRSSHARPPLPTDVTTPRGISEFEKRRLQVVVVARDDCKELVIRTGRMTFDRYDGARARRNSDREAMAASFEICPVSVDQAFD